MTVTPSQFIRGGGAVASAEVSLAAGGTAVRQVSEWLVASGRQLGIPPEPLQGLEVCLNELLANVIEHGGERGRTAPVRVHLRVGAGPDPIHPHATAPVDPPEGEATLTLRDAGIPFDPLAHTPAPAPSSLAEARPGGLGLLMVRQISAALSYRREQDENVVTVTVRWRNPAADLNGG